MFLIRAANDSDAEQIYRVHLKSIRELCSRDYTTEEINAWTSGPKPDSYITAMKNGEQMFVAIVDKEVVGFTGIKSDEICAVYVHPKFAGKGIGKALLQQAEQFLAEQKFTQARLSATANAKAFYMHHGWQVENESKHELRGGMTIRCIEMKKVFSIAED